MSARLVPKTLDIFWLGYWMGALDTEADTSSWKLSKCNLEALSGFAAVEGIDYVGLKAKQIITNYNADYPTGEEPIGRSMKEVFSKNTRYLQGRLEETLKKWILVCPETSMNINKLISGIASFLTTEELQVLSPIERKGLNEAASCLLSNNFTSAEFMSLRAVESILRRWYEKKTSKKIEYSNWGEVITRLDNEFPEDKRPKEISYLYFLKERRNAVAHPERISSEENALMTFCQVVEAIKRLYKFLT